MAKIIEAEDSDNDSSKPRTSRKRLRRSRPQAKKTKKDNFSDPGDENFSASSGGEGESSMKPKMTLIPWKLLTKRYLQSYLFFCSILMIAFYLKLADTLPSKTIPSKRRIISSKAKGKRQLGQAKKHLQPVVQVDGSDNEAPLR
jgi:hypothetical protein